VSQRHEIIGIKQVLRLEWLEKTSHLLLAGLNDKIIRQELHEYVAMRMGNGKSADRGTTSRTQVVNMLMKIWVSPESELLSFTTAALKTIQIYPQSAISIHWAMISAAYPFWYNTALQIGRLLNLQEQVTQSQIINRLKEQYGDRQTVSRYARNVIRSFVAWGLLIDSKEKGSYEKTKSPITIDKKMTNLLLEASLHSIPEGKSSINILLSSPAFFGFQLPVITGDEISQNNNRIDVIRYSLDEELLILKP